MSRPIKNVSRFVISNPAKSLQAFRPCTLGKAKPTIDLSFGTSKNIFLNLLSLPDVGDSSAKPGLPP